jgi:excisionase family DNA binding protein
MGKDKAEIVVCADRLFTSDEIAARLSCSRDKIYELVGEGMPHFRLGGGPRAEFRFDLARVERWLAGCSRANSVVADERPRALPGVFQRYEYIQED